MLVNYYFQVSFHLKEIVVRGQKNKKQKTKKQKKQTKKKKTKHRD